MGKRLTADFLFGSQMILAAVFGFGQMWHMITVSTEGVLVSYFATWTLFSLFNFSLSIAADRAHSTRISRQTIAVYGWWTAMAGGNVFVLLVQGGFAWVFMDWITILSILVAVVALFSITRDFGLKDPMTKGWLASAFKPIPHLTIGVSICMYGGEGISIIMMLVGHITISIRLAQLWFSVREAGWDRNRKASLLSEGLSEATWIVTTIVWIWALW